MTDSEHKVEGSIQLSIMNLKEEDLTNGYSGVKMKQTQNVTTSKEYPVEKPEEKDLINDKMVGSTCI